MSDIRPIKDLKNTSKISSLCPEKNMAKAELYSKLVEAEQEIENGEELLDGKTVLRNLKEKYVKKQMALTQI